MLSQLVHSEYREKISRKSLASWISLSAPWRASDSYTRRCNFLNALVFLHWRLIFSIPDATWASWLNMSSFQKSPSTFVFSNTKFPIFCSLETIDGKLVQECSYINQIHSPSIPIYYSFMMIYIISFMATTQFSTSIESLSTTIPHDL